MQVEFLDVVRLVAFIQQVGKDQARPSGWEGGVNGGFGSGAVVWVVYIVRAMEETGWVAGYDQIRLVLADEAGQILAQGEGGLQFAIRVVQKSRFLDAEDQVGGNLFVFA